MIDAPRMIPQEPAPTAMELVDNIHIHHATASALVNIIGLIGGSIGYEQDREIAINVIGMEIHAAAEAMTALTEKIRDCLED